MKYRVITETSDEKVNMELDTILRTNKSYVLVASLNNKYMLFTKRDNSLIIKGMHYIFVDSEKGGFCYFGGVSMYIYSKFDQDEFEYISALYEENTNKLFQYLKQRHDAAFTYISDTAKNTKPFMKVKSSN